MTNKTFSANFALASWLCQIMERNHLLLFVNRQILLFGKDVVFLQMEIVSSSLGRSLFTYLITNSL